MGKVIQRFGHSIDDKGIIRHDDRPTTWEAADALAGRRLDRRRNYAIIDGEVCESAMWSQCCSVCCDDREGHVSERGAGCHECGYTGRVRSGMWIPIRMAAAARDC